MLNRILGLIGWLGTALVFAAVAVRFLAPDRQPVWNGLAIAGLGCILLYILSQWREIGRMFAGRQARFGTLAAAGVFIVLGILVAVNYVASRQNKRWDLTAGQVYAVSDQTRRVLQGLEAPVSIKVFDREDSFDRFRSRLDEYEYVTDRVSVEYIDPDRNPALARQYQIQSYGTAVFEYEGRTERVTSPAEQDLTNALIKVVEGQEKKVYFVQGHGEKDPASAERGGYNGVADALRNDNFVVETLVIAQRPEVPEDASVVIVAGPETDLLPGEVDILRRYADAGGKLLLLVDPPGPDGPALTNLAGLANEWGIEIGDNVVVDVSGVGQLIGTDASVPVAASYPPHPITQDFNLLTAYPLARSVSSRPEPPAGRSPQPFIETSPRSWAETDIARLTTTGEVEMNPEQGDRQGPITIGMAVSQPVARAEGTAGQTEAEPAQEAGDQGTPQPGEQTPAEEEEERPAPEARLAVIGDSDFAANLALGIQGNRDLFLNTVNWLAQQETLISIRPKEPEDRRITLTADQQQRIRWLSIILIPGVILALGVYTWWERR